MDLARWKRAGQITPEVGNRARHGPAAFSHGIWYRLSLTVSGANITASLDGQRLASFTDTTLASGMPGITTGGWHPAYYSHLTIMSS
jgi:hypothetical protein